MNDTITSSVEVASEVRGRVTTRLLFLANTDDPASPSSSHNLDDIDEVRFRRGPRKVERLTDGVRVLELGFPDARMSGDHGSLKRRDAKWLLDDPSSKNGAVVEGGITRRALLGDGSLFELGHSFFVLRQSVIDHPLPRHLETDIDAEHLPAWTAGMATFSPALAHAYAALERLAPSAVSILIGGETGTGKEVIARAIHTLSQRGGTFTAVNCGALPSTLVESELFGHRKGAFSGAISDRRGLIRSADRGTLFLDEIGELPPSSQAALLRVLQEKEVLPVGDDRPIPVDVRIVAATLRDLDQAIEAGTFRSDLYARLVGHMIRLPALRDRREDLGLLIAALSRRIGGVRTSPSALRALLRHDWPRNIRELEQILTASSTLAPKGVIELEHLPATIRVTREKTPATPSSPPEDPEPKLEELDDADRELRARLIELFTEHEGNVFVVAEALGKQRAQIYKWIKRLSIDIATFRR